MNCLIPHEMGHYAFGELSLAVKFKKQLENELIQNIPSVTREQRGNLVEILARWIEELFATHSLCGLSGFASALHLQNFSMYHNSSMKTLTITMPAHEAKQSLDPIPLIS